MARNRALKRRRKLIVTVAVAGVTVLLTLVYAVAAPSNQAGKGRWSDGRTARSTLHDVDHSLHSMRPTSTQAGVPSSRPSDQDAIAETPVLPEDFEDDALPGSDIGGAELPRSSELLAELGLFNGSGMRGTGLRSGSPRAGSTRRGVALSGRGAGLGGFGGGSMAGGGAAAAQRGIGTDLPLSELADLALVIFDTELGLAEPSLNTFRRGAPLPVGFDPCLREDLVVSPCIRTSGELLQELQSEVLALGSAGFADLPRPGLRRFSVDQGPGQNGGGSDGSDSGGGSSLPPNGESTGGDGDDDFYPEEIATPVPAPAPAFLVSAGLMLLIRRRRTQS